MLTVLREIIDPISLVWHHRLFTIAGIDLSLGNVTVALLMLLFATRLSKLATKIIDRRVIQKFVSDKSSQNTYQTFAFYGSLAGFITLSLAIAGIPLTVFTVFGGALAIGVGFGSQNIVNNFISGIILLIEKPIKVGDVIELDAVSGSVVSIGTRSTKIKNGEGKIFVVPNSFFLEKSVLNWSFEEYTVRTNINFGVAYGSDVRLVENICTDILLNTEGVLQSPLPKVIFNDFGESNLSFQINFWCNLLEVSSLPEVQSDIRFKIDERFKQHQIAMAYPQRDFNLKLARPLDVKVTT